MTKQNLTMLIIGLVVILGFLSLLVLILQMKKNAPGATGNNNNFIPTPTTVQHIFQVPTETPIATPTLILPTKTGAIDEPLPKDLQDLSTQKQDLKSKLPINNPNFSIGFDYSEDKFIVSLNIPKDSNQKIFDDWIKNNYPAIPLDRFLIK